MSRSTRGGAVMALALLTAHQVQAAAADVHLNIDEIVVTGVRNRTRFDVVQASSILTGPALTDTLRGSIGETLVTLPGVSSTFFGPHASRPIIRGFDGDRIRVLFDGIGSIDASSVSPDHEVAGDGGGAERIEVLRGPATLLYGSSAVGGVVNIIDNRIPGAAPEGGFDGSANGGYNNNAREWFTGGEVDLAVGGKLVLHGEGDWREADDYRVKGFAGEEAEEDGIEGLVPNSDGRSKHLGGGLSYIGEGFIIGGSVSRSDSSYGSPAPHGHHEEGDDEDSEHEHEDVLVRLDVEQTRMDFKTEATDIGDVVTAVRARAAYGDYQHVELEGEEIGTIFANEGWEGRLEADHTLGALDGVIGLQYRRRDFSAVGEEAFVPGTTTKQAALFVMETETSGDWRLEGGGRLEHTAVLNPRADRDRKFLSLAASGAVAYEFASETLAGLTLSWTQRPPTAEELFANGPHLATSQFERGDAELGQEKALNAEVTVRSRADFLSGSISAYQTWYRRFIFAMETGEAEDLLPVFQFTATNATFSGFEAEAALHLIERDNLDLMIDATLDYVRATDTVNDRPLPRIPPLRYRLGAEARWSMLEARIELQGAARQERVLPLETPTKGYAFLNAKLAVNLGGPVEARVVLQGRNLLNAAGRPHTSFIKDVAPLPGRDIRLALQASF